jgi:hypothetical membrane protein
MAYVSSAVSDPKVSTVGSWLAIAAAAVALLFLAALHILSPEFDTSRRMVSEYANGQYGFVLSLMFVSWAISSCALAYALLPRVTTRAGRVGLFFLVVAGIGEAMAAVFDIKHSLHGLSALIGIPSLPIAAMLISICLIRTGAWRSGRNPVLWTANLTWISLVLMAVAFAVFITTFKQAGGDMNAGTAITALPDGVIALVGWANRLLIVAYCAWAITTAWQLIQPRGWPHCQPSKIDLPV